MPHLLTPTNITTALIAINFIAFAAFGVDKAKARARRWRVQESTLLTLAFLGGTLGAYAGRAVFRHKTRKQPFGSHLFQIAVGQMLALGGLMVVAAELMSTPSLDATNPLQFASQSLCRMHPTGGVRAAG